MYQGGGTSASREVGGATSDTVGESGQQATSGNNLQSLCNSCLPLEWVTMMSPGKLDMMNCIEGS